jgi:hypothetical protein
MLYMVVRELKPLFIPHKQYTLKNPHLTISTLRLLKLKLYYKIFKEFTLLFQLKKY